MSNMAMFLHQQIRLMRSQLRLLSADLITPNLPSGNRGRTKPVPIRLNPQRIIAGCALSLLPDQAPELPHWLLLNAFNNNRVRTMNMRVASSLFHGDCIIDEPISGLHGELYWSLSIAARAFIATADWMQHVEPIAKRLPHRVVLLCSDDNYNRIEDAANELIEYATTLEAGQSCYSTEYVIDARILTVQLRLRVLRSIRAVLAAMASVVAMDVHPMSLAKKAEGVGMHTSAEAIEEQLKSIAKCAVIDPNEFALLDSWLCEAILSKAFDHRSIRDVSDRYWERRQSSECDDDDSQHSNSLGNTHDRTDHSNRHSRFTGSSTQAGSSNDRPPIVRRKRSRGHGNVDASDSDTDCFDREP